jgi:putative SOS response-associated peptidase YedK
MYMTTVSCVPDGSGKSIVLCWGIITPRHVTVNKKPPARALSCCWSICRRDGRETCTILTTEANDLVKHYHYSMPVILPSEHNADWLSDDAAGPVWMQTVLCLYPAEAMYAMAVNHWVIDVRHQGPECVQPFA